MRVCTGVGFEGVVGGKYIASFEPMGDEWVGTVTLQTEFNYSGDPEWTTTGTDKLRVVKDTIESLIWYEEQQ